MTLKIQMLPSLTPGLENCFNGILDVTDRQPKSVFFKIVFIFAAFFLVDYNEPMMIYNIMMNLIARRTRT